MSATEETLSLLRSIDSTLKTMLAFARQRTQAQKAIASDRDLDGKWGDPLIKFNPRDWAGDSFKGCNMSQCPAEFLDLIAETFDYFASKAEEKDERTNKGKSVADYKRKDAARARGWAKRVRESWRAPAVQTGASDAWGADESGDDWPTEAEVFGERA